MKMKMKMKNPNVFWSVLMLTLMVPSMVLAQGSRPPGTGEDPHRRFREGGQAERPQGHPNVREGRKEKGRPHGGRGGASLFSVEGLSEALNLDEPQTQKMQDLLMEYRKGMIQKTAALEVAMMELEEAVARPKLDMAAVEKQAKQKEAIATDLTLFRVREMAKAKEFLSEEQFDQFRGLIEMRMTSGSYGGGRGMGRGHGMGMGMTGRGHGMGRGMGKGHGMGRGMMGEGHGMGGGQSRAEDPGLEGDGYDD